MNRIISSIGLVFVSNSVAAGVDVVAVDAPPTLSLMALGTVAAVLMARHFKR